MIVGKTAKRRVYDEERIASLLADADVDLGDADACLRVLVEHGVRQFQYSQFLLSARIEANNIRAARYWRRRSIPAHLLAPPSLTLLLIGFALGVMAVFDHAPAVLGAGCGLPSLEAAA